MCLCVRGFMQHEACALPPSMALVVWEERHERQKGQQREEEEAGHCGDHSTSAAACLRSLCVHERVHLCVYMYGFAGPLSNMLSPASPHLHCCC